MEVAGVLSALFALVGISVIVLVVLGMVRAARAVGAKAEDLTLKTKAYTNLGPQGRIATTRLRLRGALEGTRDALNAAASQDAQVGESMALFRRLSEHAAELDGQLRVLEREPDAARVDAKLSELRRRAERIMHAAEELRWAVQDRQHRFSEDELGRLTDECTQEADALRHWDRPGQAEADATTGQAATATGARGPAGQGPKRLNAARWPTADEMIGFVDRIRRPSGEANSR
ncbi:hypothetical protein ABH940_002996 [Streptacidiphilus sp. BW17]|uniref:hypothetical protein n=1 Tax=Streptacidiphilus sp. BW17 TaxID=3156274 RepID=UPI00351289D8